MDIVCPPHFAQVKTSSADGRRDEGTFLRIHRMIAFVAVLIHLPLSGSQKSAAFLALLFHKLPVPAHLITPLLKASRIDTRAGVP
jgi:hypothetical protein